MGKDPRGRQTGRQADIIPENRQQRIRGLVRSQVVVDRVGFGNIVKRNKSVGADINPVKILPVKIKGESARKNRFINLIGYRRGSAEHGSARIDPVEGHIRIIGPVHSLAGRRSFVGKSRRGKNQHGCQNNTYRSPCKSHKVIRLFNIHINVFYHSKVIPAVCRLSRRHHRETEPLFQHIERGNNDLQAGIRADMIAQFAEIDH